jgi:hypothetical protein
MSRQEPIYSKIPAIKEMIMSFTEPVIVDSRSPDQSAPALPVVSAVTWEKLVASMTVTPDANDVNGQPTDVINIRSAFREKGSTQEFAFADAPGTYPAGAPVPFSFTVPKWGISYEFAFEAGN